MRTFQVRYASSILATRTMDEILDLVDENDVVIGQKKRSEIYSEGLSNFRVVNAFVVNKDGRMWIPRRTAHKKLNPLYLDFSVGGHVESGETYEETFRRETAEELNLDISKVEWIELGTMKPSTDGTLAFMKVYEIKMNKSPKYNTDDFVEYFWLTPGEFFEKLNRGDKSKYDLPKVIKNFYS